VGKPDRPEVTPCRRYTKEAATVTDSTEPVEMSAAIAPEPARANEREVVPEVWTVPEVHEVEAELVQVLRKGLPATVRTAGRLQHLSGVLARSPRLDETAMRIAALNRLLNDVVTKLEAEPALAAGAPALFGLADGTAGLTLTKRRERCAQALGYEPETVRRHLESRIVRAVAEALREDTLRYKTRTLFGGYANNESPAADGSPRIEPSDLVHREELSSRVWSAVYLLRAEFIAVGRARENNDGSLDFEEAANNALYAMALQLHLLDQYVSDYGERIMRSGLEHHVDYLVRIASWHPPFTAEEAARLRLVMAGATRVANRDLFLEALRSGEDKRLIARWREWMERGWPASSGDT